VQMRRLGELWPVSSLTLGGGLGQLWGTTSRDAPPADVLHRLERSLEQSLQRMRLQHVDLFFLHGYLVGSEHDGGEVDAPSRDIASGGSCGKPARQ
jgi:hypothetical protein